MDLMHAITERRAVRQFRETPLADEVIRNLISVAVLAPSARNLQPWSFAVLRDRNKIAGYAEEVRRWLLANDCAGFGDMRATLEAPGYSVFHHASALVMIMATDATSQSAEDCCLAAQNFMLAARARNLGTCWIGLARPWLNLPRTKHSLGLPDHYAIVAPIVLGHPEQWPDSHGRKPPEIHWLDG